jgi:hypothetical protein
VAACTPSSEPSASRTRWACGVEQPVLGEDLLGVGDAAVGLLDERRGIIERAHEQPATEPLQPRGKRPVGVLGEDRLDGGEAHRAAVQAGGESHDRHPARRVAGHDRPLDRRGTAPARQQGGVHVEYLVLGEQRLLDQRPKRAHDHRLCDLGAVAGACDLLARGLVVDALGLGESDPELTRELGHGR